MKMGSSPSKGERVKRQDVKFKMKKQDVIKTSRELILSTELTNVCLESDALTELKAKLEKAVCWTSKYETSWSPEFSRSVDELLMEACDEMSRLIEAGNRGTADEIVRMILRLRFAWGSEVFEYLNIKSFPRERIETKTAVILAEQYFEPDKIYKTDNRICRLYAFKIRDAETKVPVFTYYLECSTILQKFYVLCLECSEGHLQITRYGSTCPSYWTVREDMLGDFGYKEQNALAKCRDPSYEQTE